MSNEAKGIILAIVSGASFGLIPLFTIPVINMGMGYSSIIFYRFLFGSLTMLAMMLWRQQSLRLTWSDAWRISILSVIYIVCAATLFASYKYISSGISTSLIYTNPIWCALIGLLFLNERLSWKLALTIAMAFLGVVMLSGVFTGSNVYTAFGLMLGLCSGIGYGIYLVVLPRLRLKKMPSIKFTFYIFFIALLLLLPCSYIFEDGIESIPNAECWMHLALVGLLPTAFSNICVTMALRLIDTTVVAVLGAFEPLTAMVIGILVLHEPFDAFTIMGGALVIASVTILTLSSKKKSENAKTNDEMGKNGNMTE